jgi:hypothetical protein
MRQTRLGNDVLASTEHVVSSLVAARRSVTDGIHHPTQQPKTLLVVGWRLALLSLAVAFLVPPGCVMLMRRLGW